MAFITLFTSPKPFSNPHIAMIQRNAIRSWLALAPDIEVLLLGEEEGLAEVANTLGVQHIPEIRRNQQGTPLISSMFELARKHSDSPLLSIINTDILLMPDFVKWAQRARQELRSFVLMGQRWDVNVRRDLEFFHGDSQELLRMIKEEGKLHPRGGSDYFLFPRECYASVPDFAIGRAGWDNWMIYEARQRGWHTVDATGAIQIIHQDHDYSHLPGSQAHYRLPETGENIRLAGGRRTIFRLDDCNYCIRNEQFYKIPLTFQRFMRGIEVFPLIKLHSFALANLFYALFHPRKVYGEFKRRITKD